MWALLPTRHLLNSLALNDAYALTPLPLIPLRDVLPLSLPQILTLFL